MRYKTLDSLCKVTSGGTPSRSKKEYWDGGDIPWIKISNIKSKMISSADEYITESGLNNSSAKLFRKGTILYTIFATLGEVGILDFGACTNQAIAGISIEKPEEITTDYLYYYLKSKRTEVNQIGRGVAQNNINLSILRKFSIPVRDIDEQKTITDSLNKVELIIEKRKQQLKQLDNLIKARFVEMFGGKNNWKNGNWNIVPVKSLINKPLSGEWGSEDKTGNGIKVLRTTNFTDNGIINFDGTVTRNIDPRKLAQKGIEYGDILIEKSGGSDKKPVGRVVLFMEKVGDYLNNNFTAVLRVNDENINFRYLFTFLFINYWSGGTRSFESKTTGIHNLNLNKYLEETRVALPPLELQERFSSFCNQVDKSKFTLTSILSMLEKLRLHLMI